MTNILLFTACQPKYVLGSNVMNLYTSGKIDQYKDKLNTYFNDNGLDYVVKTDHVDFDLADFGYIICLAGTKHFLQNKKKLPLIEINYLDLKNANIDAIVSYFKDNQSMSTNIL